MTEAAPAPAGDTIRRRRPWLALVLGMLSPGLGHVYAGRPWRGMGAFAILLLVIVPVATVLLVPFLGSPTRILLGQGIRASLALLVPIDGAIAARRRGLEPLTRWNRVWVYLLYFVATSSILIAGPKHLVSYHPVRIMKIPSGAMEPNLQIGDYILADVFHSGSASVQPGTAVVFEFPADPGVWYVKRLVGLPGQTIEIREGALLVDGHPASRRIANNGGSRIVESLGGREYEVEGCLSCNFGPVTVAEGSVFVLGDNRGRSADSRVFGSVRIPAIRGHAIGVAWSYASGVGVRWARLGTKM